MSTQDLENALKLCSQVQQLEAPQSLHIALANALSSAVFEVERLRNGLAQIVEHVGPIECHANDRGNGHCGCGCVIDQARHLLLSETQSQ